MSEDDKVVLSDEVVEKLPLLYAVLLRGLKCVSRGGDAIAFGEVMEALEWLAEDKERPNINVGICFGFGDSSESEWVEVRVNWEGIFFSRLHRVYDSELGSDHSSHHIGGLNFDDSLVLTGGNEFVGLAEQNMLQHNFFISTSRDH